VDSIPQISAVALLISGGYQFCGELLAEEADRALRMAFRPHLEHHYFAIQCLEHGFRYDIKIGWGLT
jgi:hypothetical protein